ncbi:thioredoxin domain-containing protein [Sphingomonas fuzhouensis]|uniref:thioredoxin domain-containing protein n=1 Tax=Sphingomonas fuzhouensis TaxID=3106033 RepID=UPI002AFF0A37|nr:thioredoxin domain-containing protein [Sphingomonas sp. SGZ-02]
MRLFLSLAALGPVLGLALSASSADAAQAQRKGVNWATHITQTPAGAYVIGNPAARVKLVEYVSYTCPHCADFTTQSAPVLKDQMVRSGSTSIEIRHYIRDRLDLAAALIARCGGAATFARLNDTIFAQQRDWLKRGMEFDQANAQRIGAYPPAAQMRAEADGSGLTTIGKSAGLTEAQITACLSDRVATDRIIAMTTAAPDTIEGTPGFFINGKQAMGVFTWEKLLPLLRASGAR